MDRRKFLIGAGAAAAAAAVPSFPNPVAAEEVTSVTYITVSSWRSEYILARQAEVPTAMRAIIEHAAQRLRDEMRSGASKAQLKESIDRMLQLVNELP